MLVNIDISTVVHPFLNRVCEKNYFYEDMLYPFVDQYKDTAVTDLLFNIFCQYSATDSTVLGTYEEKYFQREECGKSVDYKNTFGSLYKLNCLYGVDPFDVWIKRCRDVGIHPWLSIRMNDAHNNGWEPFSGRTSFFYEAKEKGWLLGPENYGYYGWNFNYEIPEVRERMLAYIAEQLDRYDVHGIELDFLREIICFAYHSEDIKECTRIMNSFIADVKEEVKKASEKWGHKILLAVRVMRDFEQSLRYGFDPCAWDVDVLVPSPRWASSDSGIAVSEWKKLCPRAKIFPCIETLFAVEPTHSGIMSAEVVRGHAASFREMGADDIYLYNFFSDPDTPHCKDGDKTGLPYMRNVSLYSSLDSYPKRFAVVGQSSEHYPDTFPTWRPFPCNNGEFDIVTGDIPKDKRAYITVGTAGDIENAEIYVNGDRIRDWSMIDLTYIPGIGAQPEGYVSPETVCFRAHISTSTKIQKVIIKNSEICHLEIYVY